MAKGRKPSSRRPAPGADDDAFVARVLEFTAWARERTQVLIVAGVIVVLLTGGLIYYFNQRARQLDAAAAQLEVVQQTAMMAAPEAAISELQGYLARFGGTPYGIEARLLLGEILLEEGRIDEAVETLREVAPSTRDPLRIQATFLLATALEQAERWDEAADVYVRLRDGAELTFQRREAAEGLSRARLAQNDTTGAADAYRELLDQLEEDHPARPYYEMRLAELTRGEF